MLPCKKRGRPTLLGHDLDTQVQLYLKKVRESGGVVSARIAIAAARGIIMASVIKQNYKNLEVIFT